MTKDEVLKLALEALENSVDLVVEDAYNAEKLYGNYPTRQGKVGGLKILADQHKEAITALKERLAQPEHDTEAHYKGVINDVQKLFNDKRKAQPEQEPVATKLQTQQFNCFHVSAEDFQRLKELPVGTKLYTTPPQRKPLTLGQKQRLWSSVGDRLTLKDRVNAYGLAIEAAHHIKENT
jgi:hypothetical protein